MRLVLEWTDARMFWERDGGGLACTNLIICDRRLQHAGRVLRAAERRAER